MSVRRAGQSFTRRWWIRSRRSIRSSSSRCVVSGRAAGHPGSGGPRKAYVAGWHTEEDWRVFRGALLGEGSSELWKKAYEEYFVRRLELRYLEPIRVLQRELHFQGEGFSIVAIQC